MNRYRPLLSIPAVFATILIVTFASPLGSKIGTIGTNTLFTDHPEVEASGLVWIPNSSLPGGRRKGHKHGGGGLLAGVDDAGRIFMINPDDDSEYYLSEFLNCGSGECDFEGITIDPFLARKGQNRLSHVYAMDEDHAALILYSYSFSLPHNLTVVEESRTDFSQALPCYPPGLGIESLTLYAPSASNGAPAEFLAGLQSDGVVYKVDSTGSSTGRCIDVTSAMSGGVNADIAGSQYDPVHNILYTIYGAPKRLAAVSVDTGCLLGDWETEDKDYEGLTIRGNRAYIASDDEPSRIDEFVWNPTQVQKANRKTRATCTSSCNFNQCVPTISPTRSPSAKPSEHPTTSPSTSPTTSMNPTISPTLSPTLNPTTAPTLNPTIAPTSSPTSSSPPSITCTQDMSYRVNGKLNKDCHWITFKSKRRSRMCQRGDVPGPCPVSCGICCANDSEFTFRTTTTTTSNNGNGKKGHFGKEGKYKPRENYKKNGYGIMKEKVRNCQWIEKRYNKRKGYCDARKKIKAACAQACRECFEPAQ